MITIYKIAFINIIIFNLILTLGYCNNRITEQEREKAKVCTRLIKALSVSLDLYNLDSFEKN